MKLFHHSKKRLDEQVKSFSSVIFDFSAKKSKMSDKKVKKRDLEKVGRTNSNDKKKSNGRTSRKKSDDKRRKGQSKTSKKSQHWAWAQVHSNQGQGVPNRSTLEMSLFLNHCAMM